MINEIEKLDKSIKLSKINKEEKKDKSIKLSKINENEIPELNETSCCIIM